MQLLFEKAKACPSCWERTQFYSEPMMCAVHTTAPFAPSWIAADWHVIHARDCPCQRCAPLARLEAKLDALIAGLKARGSL